MYTRHEKKRVLKELLDQINPRGHAQTNGSKTRSKMRYPFHTKHMHCSPTNNNNNNNTNNPFSLSLSLFKKGILPALNAKEGNLCLEYYICARALERMCGLKDLKKISFSPSCVSKERRHKKIHLGSRSFFFGLSAQKFLVFRSAPLWKKEAQKEET